MGKRIVIALGGNALGNNLPEQMIAVKQTAKAIADLMDKSIGMSAAADRLENEATKLAQEQIDAAIAEVSDGK